MKRREMLIFSVAAAFLSACGGGTTAERDPEFASSSEHSELQIDSPPLTGSSDLRQFAQECAKLMLATPIPADFVASPRQYFLSKGISEATVDANKELIDAIDTVTQPDFRTALAIGDREYLLGSMQQTGILDSTQLAALGAENTGPVHVAMKNASSLAGQAKLSSLVGHQLHKLIGPVSPANLPRALMLVLTYAMVYTDGIPA